MNYNPDYVRTVPTITLEQLTVLQTLDSKMPLDELLQNKKSLDRVCLDFVHASAKLEHTTYKYENTKLLLQSGMTSGTHRLSDANMILNINDALECVLGYYEDPITPHYIRSIHHILSGRDLLLKHQQGSIRNHAVFIGGSIYQPPAAVSYLSSELEGIIEFNETIKEPFSKAIHLHLNLCYLQAFTDINKRTARTVQIYSMMNSGVVPLLFGEGSNPGFVESVVNYYETGNYTDYVSWFIEAYTNMLTRLDVV